MIADIRICNTPYLRARGVGKRYFKIDLMKGSLEELRDWFLEKGIKESELLVFGFEDWEVSSIMPIWGAYLIKKVVFGYYDGDEFIVKCQLQKGISWDKIVSDYFVFLSEDKLEVVTHLLRGYRLEKMVEILVAYGGEEKFLKQCEEEGIVLATAKGFYVSSEYQ